MSNGVITLSGIAGLSFDIGNGTADEDMVFNGTVGDINAALDGLIFDPTQPRTRKVSHQKSALPRFDEVFLERSDRLRFHAGLTQQEVVEVLVAALGGQGVIVDRTEWLGRGISALAGSSSRWSPEPASGDLCRY